MASVFRVEGGLESTLSDRLDTKRIYGSLRKAFQGVHYRRRSSESDYTDKSKFASLLIISIYRERLSKLVIFFTLRNPKVGIMSVPVGVGKALS